MIDIRVEPHHNYLDESGTCHHNSGKTRTAAAEVAIHATGRYPDWWKGHRFDSANEWTIVGETNESVRDIQQAALVGTIDEDRKPSGTGWIPHADIISLTFRQSSIANVAECLSIKHFSGGVSRLYFKSYEMGASKMQGVARDGVWMDEEAISQGEEIFTELQTRLVDRQGILLFSRTPLLGLTPIIKHFVDGGPGVYYATATWKESPHITEEIQEKLTARYPSHERATRTAGIPMMGTGAVYDVPDEELLVDPFKIPLYYRRICGIDYGVDHPAAAAWLAHDADTDIIYLYDCYKQSGETAAYHARTINSRGKWIPVSWPHDGLAREKGTGRNLRDQYEENGVNMLHQYACLEASEKGSDGRKTREPATLDLLERMRTGRFKVFDSPNCHLFLEEKRMLHRKDGRIVPVRDDVESAVRYALMMIRFALASSDKSSSTMTRDLESAEYNPLSMYGA